MRFLKAHYEKIILSIVLLGLAAAAALMPIKVSQERQKEEDRKNELLPKTVKPFPHVDVSSNLVVLARLEKAEKLKLDGEHNLFNPVRWQKNPDGSLLKGALAGLKAVKITGINPLKLKVSYDGTTGGKDDLKYIISIVKETEHSGKQTRTATVGAVNQLFKLQGVDGPVENPTAVTVLLKGPGGVMEKEPIKISQGQPYERVIGFAADLSYEPDKLVRKSLRVKDDVAFGGESYIVVAITQNEVVLSARSNKKQTTLELQPQSK